MVKLLRGWQLYQKQVQQHTTPNNRISIVIPFRDEAQNLPALFESLERLEYPKHDFELVLVDDHSSDGGDKIANDWVTKTKCSARLVSTKTEGKKAAQALGVKLATFDVIACTDADCQVPVEWLKVTSACFKENSVKLAFGPVHFSEDAHGLQSLEFLSLVASTMAMLKLGWPVMGNAANMAFRKDVYLASEEALAKMPSASGDDVFLLHHITKLGGKIETLQAATTTKPQPNLKSFLNQRLRWAAKAKYYNQTAAIAVGVLVLAVNTVLLAGFLALLFGAVLPLSFWLLVVVKWLMDFVFLQWSAKYFNQKIKPHLFLLQEMLNVVYVPTVAVLSQIAHFTWKGRRY